MCKGVNPVNVSPLIRGLRWTLLACGIACGMIKLRKYETYEETARPKRELEIKQKYERLRKESSMRDSNELYTVGTEFEITEFPPGWNDDV